MIRRLFSRIYENFPIRRNVTDEKSLDIINVSMVTSIRVS